MLRDDIVIFKNYSVKREVFSKIVYGVMIVVDRYQRRPARNSPVGPE